MTALNRIRHNFYLDSVALMRLSQQLSALPEVETAALMIGSTANKQILDEAGLLSEEGRSAGVNDLIIALRANNQAAAEAALTQVDVLLERPSSRGGDGTEWRPKTLNTAVDRLPDANLALISVPGEFAAAEARKALRNNLHVMIFSDNVPLADERSLKEEARERGLLLMGPDCGTALIGGIPLAFANQVPRGDIGIIAASGTGLQEVSCLIARGGKGISHGIGVGGRDLSDAVGGIMTLMAIEALDNDPRTQQIIIISKPPSETIAKKILDRVEQSAKPFTICFVGLDTAKLPENARGAATLQAAAEQALDSVLISPSHQGIPLEAGRRWIRGLYSGGTLCAEAQVVLRRLGATLYSNVPIPGTQPLQNGVSTGHAIIDLGADEYTVGKPHPMLDPAVRNEVLQQTLADSEVAVVLLDVVLGYGAHQDPAGAIATVITKERNPQPVIIASVCGTESDPQDYSRQVRTLEQAGIIVTAANAQAVELAIEIVRDAAQGTGST